MWISFLLNKIFHLSLYTEHARSILCLNIKTKLSGFMRNIVQKEQSKSQMEYMDHIFFSFPVPLFLLRFRPSSFNFTFWFFWSTCTHANFSSQICVSITYASMYLKVYVFLSFYKSIFVYVYLSLLSKCNTI